MDRIFSPARELPSAPAADDANNASQCSNKCCRTVSRCKSPALRYQRSPPAPFRPCEFPAETGLAGSADRSEEHTSELQSHLNLVCRLLLEKKKTTRKGCRPNDS